MENKEIQRLYEMAKSESYSSSHDINKQVFSSLLSSMVNKLLLKKDDASHKQLAVLQQMDKFLERLTLKNVMYVFQCKLIIKMESQIMILEQDKRDLINRSIDKIKKLEDEKKDLLIELENVKKRIKNDKESS
jgi:hypothetical protein